MKLNINFITDCNIDGNQDVTHTDVLYADGTCGRYYLRTYEVKDSCDNGPAIFVHRINVVDTVKPVITGTLNDATVYMDASCVITLPTAATTSVTSCGFWVGWQITSKPAAVNLEITSISAWRISSRPAAGFTNSSIFFIFDVCSAG